MGWRKSSDFPPPSAAVEKSLRAIARQQAPWIRAAEKKYGKLPASRANPLLMRPLKEQVTVRIDADVLAWLRGQGKGYQSRINDVLRTWMEAQPAARS
ncbi:MAG: BrnA antitoxin family protein [Terriglobales bacterium]|jgi:uncharacterized protein (DUF4415 family)